MKPQFSKNHPSYQNHRRQFWTQIFLPMILTVLLIIAMAVITGIAAFGANDNSPIWAAISTIWLVIPVMFFGLLFLVLVAGLVYLLARTLQVLPPYTSKAQYYVNRGASETKRFSDMAARPVLYIEGIIASIKAIFGRI
jgi:FtsH-binding integral membrane protein